MPIDVPKDAAEAREIRRSELQSYANYWLQVTERILGSNFGFACIDVDQPTEADVLKKLVEDVPALLGWTVRVTRTSDAGWDIRVE